MAGRDGGSLVMDEAGVTEVPVQSNLCLPACLMNDDDEPGVIEAAVAGFAARSKTDMYTDNLT